MNQEIPPSNEQLCALAQQGDMQARDRLLEENWSFLKKTASDILWHIEGSREEPGISRDDLIQEGSLGLLKAIPSFDAEKGVKFLSYAAAFVRNAMTDVLRANAARFEKRIERDEDGFGYRRLWIDEVLSGRNREIRSWALADPRLQTPEQIYIRQETLLELYDALEHLHVREQTYILYRYGFTDDSEHTLIGTAEHFHLSMSRAKTTEKQALKELRKGILGRSVNPDIKNDPD